MSPLEPSLITASPTAGRLQRIEPGISVVVPVYRSREACPWWTSWRACFRCWRRGTKPILVNDGSPDNSWPVIERLAREHALGQRRLPAAATTGSTTRRSVAFARPAFPSPSPWMRTLQHPPEEIPVLLAKLEGDDCDVVYGSPHKLPQGVVRNLLTANIKRILARVMGVPSVRNIYAFRALRTDLRDSFTSFQSPTY